jgi:hypothetical protein
VRGYAIEPGFRRERVVPAGEAQVRAGRDQFVDLGRTEVLQQARHVVVDTVKIEPACLDKPLEVGQATQIDADPYAFVQCRDPPRHGAAHRRAERCQAA